MSTIASKNLYDLLGNDPDQDPELRTAPPPVVPIDKPVARKGKRDGPAEAPIVPPSGATDAPRGRGRGRGGRGGGRGRGRGAHHDGFGGNEEAFQDTDAGSARNRDKPTDDGFQEERRGGRGARGAGFEGREGRGGRGRGGRGGGRFASNRDDRHSRTIHSGPDDQAKQAAKGWGDETSGAGEWKDEQAGEAIAWEESKQGYDTAVDKPVNAEGETPATENEEVEPEEDKTKSYSDYLAEQAQKKLQLGGNLQARQANEGAGKTLPEGKAIEKEGETEYFAGTGGKARRERERKEKNTYVLEHDIQAREQPAVRGGARGGRGGRGRGEGRGRGLGGGRGARGEFRGRGGRGYGGPPGTGGPPASGAPASGTTPNVTNSADFPTLGS